MALATHAATKHSNPSFFSGPGAKHRHSQPLLAPSEDDPSEDGSCLAAVLPNLLHRLQTRVATSIHELEAAADLVRRRYAWRGYDCHSVSGGHSGELTLVTSDKGTAAGTLTLRPDGPSGLHADSGFRRELDAARRLGHRLGEVTRLALESEADSKAVLASLFYVGHWIFHFHHGVTSVIVEVNPRHAPFYQRALGFALASGERICERVGAPGVLLQAPIDVIGHRAAAFREKVLRRATETVPSTVPALG